MTQRDPAAARFAIINLVRIIGVACVVVGLLMAEGRMFAGVPRVIAYLLLANGMVDIFVIPLMLARKWRTPK